MPSPLVGLLIEPVFDLISKLVPDKDKARKMAHEIATLAEKQAHALSMAQVEVNKQEASHKSLFVAGWRPFTGWVCGVSLAFNYMVIPLAGAVGVDIEPFDMAVMMPVLLGMLGLGTLRTVEKRSGVAREQ